MEGSSSFLIATRREKAGACLFGVALAAALLIGFIPTSRNLFGYLCHFLGRVPGKLGQDLSFPVLAAFFYLSLPRPRVHVSWPTLWECGEVSLLPLVISGIYGALRPHAGLADCFSLGNLWPNCLWYMILAPLGEECLFRGWFYGLLERLWPNRLWSQTNPLPIALWVSSLGFSLWHLQNAAQDPWAGVLFQVAYTLFTGLWLGYLRYRTTTVWVPIVAHILLNTAANF